MKFIDTHIHLQDYKSECATDILQQAVSFGVDKIVCAAITEKDWETIANFHQSFKGMVVPAFGLHPWYLDNISVGWEQRLADLLNKFPQALVGETGLDGLHNISENLQKQIFEQHIILAKEYRPLIIHAVKCQAWLEKYWKKLPEKFVFHSYNGKKELLQKIISYGGYVSFSASILHNPHKEEILRLVPKQKLLLETDGPYQGPNKGQEILPSYIPTLAHQIAILRNEKLADFATQVYQNSMEFIQC